MCCNLYARNFSVKNEDFFNATNAITELNYLICSNFYYNGEFETSRAAVTESGEKPLRDNSNLSKILKAVKTVKSIGTFMHSMKP